MATTMSKLEQHRQAAIAECRAEIARYTALVQQHDDALHNGAGDEDDALCQAYALLTAQQHLVQWQNMLAYCEAD